MYLLMFTKRKENHYMIFNLYIEIMFHCLPFKKTNIIADSRQGLQLCKFVHLIRKQNIRILWCNLVSFYQAYGIEIWKYGIEMWTSSTENTNTLRVFESNIVYFLSTLQITYLFFSVNSTVTIIINISSYPQKICLYYINSRKHNKFVAKILC